MCDDNALDDMVDYLRRAPDVSRRRFGALAAGAGLVAALPRAANAAEVVESEVDIRLPDGTADAYFAHPKQGRHAAVLVWTDIFGLRPAFRQMGRRLAESGYAVLVPNPFYRVQRAPTVAANASLQDPETRKTLMGMMQALTPDTQVADTKGFIAWLDGQKSVDRKRRIATTGYCMGGPITMRAAAAFPERIGAAASFHGGGLVTDKPDSPHLLVPKMRVQYLIAIAENDDQREPEAKNVLRKAFDDAKLPAEIEVYAGAMHGWCPPGSAVYNEAQAERAWARMLALFDGALA
jgi:carboxymethylenebutenolidase